MKKYARIFSLIGGLCAIAAGIFLFTKPVESLISLSFVFAIIMLVNGGYDIFKYVSDKEAYSASVLWNGIFSVLLGVLLLGGSWLDLATFLPYLFAFWVLFAGISSVITAFALKKVTGSLGAPFWLGVLGILSGLILCAHPLFTGGLVSVLIGVAFIARGCMAIATFVELGKKN